MKIDPFIGGVEMALWDTHGKQLGAPFSRTTRWENRNVVSVAYCGGILPPEKSAKHARTTLETSFLVLKTKAGSD